ncbi:MAG: histidine phosphatase family protein [Chloroflexota bacterium]
MSQPTSRHTSDHTTIWLARHGEVHNPNDVLYGRLPRFDLSVNGVRQAQALSTFLAGHPLAAVYSSPLLRARRTAGHIVAGRNGLPIRQDSGLLEVKTGWQGRPSREMVGVDWYARPHSPGDDSLHSIRDRTSAWVRRVLARHPGQHVAAVSHGDPILILVGHLRGTPLEPRHLFPTGYIPTACVFKLVLDSAGRLIEDQMFVPHAAG